MFQKLREVRGMQARLTNVMADIRARRVERKAIMPRPVTRRGKEKMTHFLLGNAVWDAHREDGDKWWEDVAGLIDRNRVALGIPSYRV